MGLVRDHFHVAVLYFKHVYAFAMLVVFCLMLIFSLPPWCNGGVLRTFEQRAPGSTFFLSRF